MATYKVSMLFNEDVNGWAESWYWEPAFIGFPATAKVVIGQAQIDASPALAGWYNVCRARALLLNQRAKIVALRISDVNSKRVSLLDDSTAAIDVDDFAHRDVKRRSLLCTAQAGDDFAYRETRHLRGIPDSACNLDVFGISQLEGVAENFSQYFSALVQAEACMKVLVKDVPGGTNPDRDVLKVEVLGVPGTVVVTTAGAHGLAALDAVRIRSVRTVDSAEPPPINKVWRVQPFVDGTHDALTSYSIPLTLTDSQLGFRYVGGGKSQKRFFAYPPLRRFIAMRFATHRTGAAFFAGRGRSRKR